MDIQYGLIWDRDFLLDLVFSTTSVITTISSLTIYPANFYLLIGNGPAMKWDIRVAYLVNIIAHIAFDWIVSFFVRAYGVPPFGLFYSEGILNRLGCSRPFIMGVLGSCFISIICTFYVLMMRMHQLTVAHEFNSYWKLSRTTQTVLYVSMIGICIINVVGFVIFGADVENYTELIETPELSWLDKRGGALLLFAEPDKYSDFRREIYILLLSCLLFLPLFSFFMAHALIYLRENERMGGAIVFFIIPLFTILLTSVVDLRDFIPDPVFAAIRFTCVLLMYVNPPQFGLVFILRNETHRRILLRRFQKFEFVSRFRKAPQTNVLITLVSTDANAAH